MAQKNDLHRKTTEPTWLFLFGLGSAVFLLGFQYDFSEHFWTVTRSLELWELDELVLAIFAVLIAAIVILKRGNLALNTQIEDLIAEQRKVSQMGSPKTDDTNCTIKCLGCGKYQIHGDHWFSIEDIVNHTEQPDLLGGVCPDCRSTPNR